MATVSESLEQIIQTLREAEADAEKFDGGVDAPGTRVRKAAMEASKALKSLRAQVSDVRNERKSSEG